MNTDMSTNRSSEEIEDKKIRLEELRKKYGDAHVAVIPSDVVALAKLKEGWSGRRKGLIHGDGIVGELLHVIGNRMEVMPRYLAELDPSFKQPIPYVIVVNEESGNIFCTRRLGGDKRLQNKISIGMGGHVEEGETLTECMYRELAEEIGLTADDISSLEFLGYINDNTSEVSSVHLGLAYILKTTKYLIRCLEPDALTGTWGSLDEMRKYWQAGHFESWTSIVYEQLIKRGAL